MAIDNIVGIWLIGFVGYMLFCETEENIVLRIVFSIFWFVQFVYAISDVALSSILDVYKECKKLN